MHSAESESGGRGCIIRHITIEFGENSVSFIQCKVGRTHWRCTLSTPGQSVRYKRPVQSQCMGWGSGGMRERGVTGHSLYGCGKWGSHFENGIFQTPMTGFRYPFHVGKFTAIFSTLRAIIKTLLLATPWHQFSTPVLTPGLWAAFQ